MAHHDPLKQLLEIHLLGSDSLLFIVCLMFSGIYCLVPLPRRGPSVNHTLERGINKMLKRAEITLFPPPVFLSFFIRDVGL